MPSRNRPIRKHLNWHREGASACSASAMTGEDI
jgi:hypothetical protein